MTWDDHKKNFARLARDGGYTIAQYAAEFNLNPNTDDEENQTASGAPSLEDLDKIARERAANRRADAALWIEQRREEIADIVDTGGYGDVDTEGVSNDPWLEQDLDEDEEEDEEVTRKLYGDDD